MRVGDLRSRLLVGVGVAAVALGVRLLGLGAQWLWFDELLSARFAGLPVSELMQLGGLPDPHPPLYYLQLHFWMVFGTSDGWILLNSVLWSTAAVVSLLHTARAVFGGRVAVSSALLLALAPLSLMFAHQARMYSLLTCLAVWAWYFHHCSVAQGRAGPRELAGLVVTELCMIYAHVGGVVMAALLCGYAALSALAERPQRTVLLRWLGAHAIVAVGALPLVPILLGDRGADWGFSYAVAPGMEEILRNLSAVILGDQGDAAGWPYLPAALGFLVLAALGLLAPPARRLSLAFLVAPTALLVLLSHALKPVFHFRLLVFSLPFVALVLALVIEAVAARLVPRDGGQRRLVACGLLALLLCGSGGLAALRLADPPKRYDFERAAAVVAERAEPGDVVYVPHRLDFVCWSWYFLGPSRGFPLIEHPVLRRGEVVVATRPAGARLLAGRTVWLVRVDWHRRPPLPGYILAGEDDFKGVLVERFVPVEDMSGRR